MKAWPVLSAIAAAGAAAALPAAASTMAAMRWHRRVVLMAAPSPQDARAIAQRRILSDWRKAAADRDISLVEVSGTQVAGAVDDAPSLNRRFGLKPGRFRVLLIGKDGHVALRSSHPIAAARLQAAIDAMPMRQAGDR